MGVDERARPGGWVASLEPDVAVHLRHPPPHLGPARACLTNVRSRWLLSRLQARTRGCGRDVATRTAPRNAATLVGAL